MCEDVIVLTDKQGHDVANYFQKHFEIAIADTDELQEEVYRIRYDVYCQEFGYESSENFSDQMEQDEFDAESVHCLVRYRNNPKYVGCLRVVLCNCGEQYSLPFHLIYRDGNTSADQLLNGSTDNPVAVEISRLALRSEFRCPTGLKSQPAANSDEEVLNRSRYNMHLMHWGLYLATAMISAEARSVATLAVMEKKLARYTRRYGCQFKQLGHSISYRGTRALYCDDALSMLTRNVDRGASELMQVVHNQIHSPLIRRLKSISCIQMLEHKSNSPADQHYSERIPVSPMLSSLSA